MQNEKHSEWSRMSEFGKDGDKRKVATKVRKCCWGVKAYHEIAWTLRHSQCSLQASRFGMRQIALEGSLFVVLRQASRDRLC